jgi:beta-phosphoglucomutase
MTREGGTPLSADTSLDAGVIFDMDGVIVDSARAHRESWQMLAREMGRSVSDEEFLSVFGRPSRDIIRILFGGDRSDEEIARMDDRKEALYRDGIRDAVPAMPGAVSLIEALLQAGLRLAVASSGPPENIDLVLDSLGIRGRFGAVVTGFDVRRGKPDPECFLLAAARLGVAPARSVVIEDAPAGIEAARRAGMKAVALVGSHPPEKLRGADLIVSNLEELSFESVMRLIDPEFARRR